MVLLREKIGQMIMIGLRGEELTEEEQRLLGDYPFGGFILFSHNVVEPKQILSLCRSLWEKGRNHPPFIAIDQEGGRVHRLPKPFTHFPAAALLGRTRNPKLAYRVGLATARELSAVGINLNFAPVLDVRSNPDNPVIGDRALSSDPEQAMTLGWSIVRGLRDGRVIPCGKHFPGHGDTTKDSHVELPVVKKDLTALKSVELPPFMYACRNQIESLMTAHVLYPHLDPNYPATLSHPIITSLLRQELSYGGVVFGDDLEMNAISDNYSLEDAVTLSVQAGVDVLMFCHDQSEAAEAYDLLSRQAEKNPQTKARAEESYQRIGNLKQLYLGAFAGCAEDQLMSEIGLAEHQKIVAEIQGSL